MDFSDVHKLGLKAFAGVKPEDIEKCKFRFSKRRLPSRTLIFEEGDPGGDIIIPITGKLLCLRLQEDGREHAYSFVSAGDIVGHISAIDDGPRSLAIYTQSACDILTMSKQDFWTLLNQSKEFRRNILIDLTSLIRRLTERSFQLTAMSVQQRLSVFLLTMIEASYDLSQTPKSIEINIPSHAQITNFIGANREAVSRAMSDLKSMKIVEYGEKRQRLRILSVSRMRSHIS